MSAETGTVMRDLTTAPRRSPAAQDQTRDGEPCEPVRASYGEVTLLPGYGAQPDRCQAMKPVGFCQEHGHVQIASADPCGTRRCPVHWYQWRQEAVVAAVARLAAYRYVQEGSGRRMLHLVVSPPQGGWWDSDRFWRMRSASYEIAAAAGARGGFVVPHPYRSSDVGDHVFETITEHGDWAAEKGMWSLFRDLVDDWGEMARFIEPGPHYHMLAACEDFDPDAVPDRWVVKNIRSLDRFHRDDLESYRSMVAPAMYLLSHAGFEQGRQTVTYWGEVHPNAFNPEEELSPWAWDKIQRMAEEAVGALPGEEEEGAGGERTCAYEECESVVLSIDQLPDYLADPSWCESIGYEQLLQLKGIYSWSIRVDRPPPSAMCSERSLLDWLERQGRASTAVVQRGLDAFGADLWGCS